MPIPIDFGSSNISIISTTPSNPDIPWYSSKELNNPLKWREYLDVSLKKYRNSIFVLS